MKMCTVVEGIMK